MQTMIHHRCRFAAIVFVIQDTWKRIVQWFLLVDSDPSTFVLYPHHGNLCTRRRNTSDNKIYRTSPNCFSTTYSGLHRRTVRVHERLHTRKLP